MDRAEPAMIFIAPSKLLALRSSIFSSAIWRSCLRVTEPTGMRPGSPLPFSRLAAFFR